MMDPTLDDGLHALAEATELAKDIRIELTEDYLQLIARVEAMPQNQPHADKSWVWTLVDWSARHIATAVQVR